MQTPQNLQFGHSQNGEIRDFYGRKTIATFTNLFTKSSASENNHIHGNKLVKNFNNNDFLEASLREQLLRDQSIRRLKR